MGMPWFEEGGRRMIDMEMQAERKEIEFLFANRISSCNFSLNLVLNLMLKMKTF